MRISSLIAFLLLCVVGPAHADLSSTERNEVKKVWSAGESLATAGEALAQMIDHANAKAGNVSLLTTLIDEMNQLNTKVHDGFTSLVIGPGSGLFAFTSSSGPLNKANYWCNSGCLASGARDHFQAIKVDGGQPQAMRDLAEIGRAAVEDARASIQSFNVALSYASPFPLALSDCTTRDFGALSITDTKNDHAPYASGPSVCTVGPHGDSYDTHGTVHFGALQMLSGLSVVGASGGMAKAFNQIGNGEPAWSTDELTAWRSITSNTTSMLRNILRFQAALADIPTTDAECGMTPSHLIARAQKLIISDLTDEGLPFYFSRMTSAAYPVLAEAMVTRPVSRAAFSGTIAQAVNGAGAAFHSIVMSGWRFTDGSQAALFEFNARHLFTSKVLRAQFETPVTTHTSPLCADTTAPTVSVTAPAASATLNKIVTLTATATDNIAIRQVQFTVDGANVGRPVILAPFTRQWDSSEVANGTRLVRAVATDYNGNTTTSSSVSVTVSNP